MFMIRHLCDRHTPYWVRYNTNNNKNLNGMTLSRVIQSNICLATQGSGSAKGSDTKQGMNQH